jgi:hypothetical protein
MFQPYLVSSSHFLYAPVISCMLQSLHSVTTQKTGIFSNTDLKNSNQH